MTLTDVRGTDYYLLDDVLTDEAREVGQRVRHPGTAARASAPGPGQ